MIDLQYLVVGTGRCGTLYMAKLLTAMGVPCSHESLFNWQGIKYAVCALKDEIPTQASEVSTRWNHHIKAQNAVAEASCLAVPFLNHPICRNVPVIHLVRNPIKVIDSFVRGGNFFSKRIPRNKYEWFIDEHMPPRALRRFPSAVERAAYFYLHWNKIIEKTVYRDRVHLFYRIEDRDIPAIAQFVNSDKEDVYVDEHTNTWRHHNLRRKEIKWRDIPDSTMKEELMRKAKFYGYDTEDTNERT